MGSRSRALFAISCILMGAVACAPHPRSGIEPLPEVLEIAAEHEVPRRRIEGQGLCLVIVARDSDSARGTLDLLETHLVENKGWSADSVGQFIDWAPVSLLQRGPRALVAGSVEDFLHLAVSGHECRALEPAMIETPDGVVVSIWLWER